MIFNEKMIDAVFEAEVSGDNDSVTELRRMAEDQPGILAYLAQENLELLTDEEYDYLAFLANVIYKVYSLDGAGPDFIEPTDFDGAEEKNWEILNASSGKRFRDRITPFFENYVQEDLLAFVEDALTEDDLPIVTKEGREPMFITLKTLIDVLEMNSKPSS